MAILTSQNVESELSYAYIHAVSAAAHMECACAPRHLDNSGVDATISARERFASDSILTDISLHVQLKATTGQPRLDARGRYPYFFRDINRYDQMRAGAAIPPRILVVLYLPPESADWFLWSEERISLQRCAFWVSLVGAPESENDTGTTVHLPRAQSFSPDGLRQLMTSISRLENPKYER